MNPTHQVKAAQAGDFEAFQALIELHRERLRRMAYYYVRNDADAEDVVHETIYRALIALPKLRQPGLFATWLTRIAINCALAVLKQRKRTVLDGNLAAEQLSVCAPATDERLDLTEAIRHLDSKQKQVIVYKYFQDLTIEDISVLLQMPIGTVKTILHKGLKALRKQFADDTYRKVGQRNEANLEEAIYRLRDDLKRRAESLVVVPEQYELIIDDYKEYPQIGGRAVFVWSEPGTDNGIYLELSKKGELLHYSIDADNAAEHLEELSDDELRGRAEKFVLDHYPKALEQFVSIGEKKTEQGISLDYKQQAMGLPLPHSGFWVHVTRRGTVIEFRYRGRQKNPETPKRIIPKEKVLKHIADTVDFRLTLSLVRESVHDMPQGDIRLVYQPYPHLVRFDADEDRAEFTDTGKKMDEEAEEHWLPVPVQPPEAPSGAERPLEIHELIGFHPEEYEIIRETDIDGKHGIVWRKRGWEPSGENDLSLDAFLLNRTEGTIKAMVDPESGRLISFMRFEKSAGDLNLSRDECLGIALRLLACTHSGIEPYVLLKQEEEQDSDAESFVFQIRKNGVVLETEQIRIGINKTTGQPDHLMGLTFPFPLDRMAAVDTTPRIDAGQARRLYLDGIDLRLEWDTDYAAKTKRRRYRLWYRVEHKESGLVDAHTGQLI